MSSYFRKSLSICGSLAKYFCIAHCTFTYIGNLVLCTGPSMEPTLYTNDILLTDCITPRYNRIANGDIIIAKLPSDPNTLICKRVVGMPGDRLFYTNPTDNYRRPHLQQRPTVNMTDVLQKSSGASSTEIVAMRDQCKRKFGMVEVIVPLGHVWIEGDNRENSGDSRYYGTIPQGLIMSRVVARIWPLNTVTSLTK